MILKQQIHPGDIVARAKNLGLMEHVGVFLGAGLVAENSPERGEHLSTLAEFAEGKPIRVHSGNGNTLEVLRRAKKVLDNPEPYDVLRNNCEHTASKIVQGYAKSPQLMAALVILFVFMLFILARSGKGA